MFFGRHGGIGGFIQPGCACTGWEVSTATATGCGAGPSLPQVRRAQPFKVRAWRAGQRESDSILCITEGSAAALGELSWTDLCTSPGLFLSLHSHKLSFCHSIIQRLQQRRQDQQQQQQQDLTPPRQGASPIHLWKGKRRGLAESTPCPSQPHTNLVQSLPWGRGTAHPALLCAAPLSPAPSPKLALGPILLNNLATGCFCKPPAPKEK